jgi:hypothetical protein
VDDGRWAPLAHEQSGVMARRQLLELGVSRDVIRAHVAARRWAWRTESVLTTTTGPLSWNQRLWVAVLHASPGSLIGGLTATKVHGLKNWDRDLITVIVDDELSFDPVEGVSFFRSRRPIAKMQASGRLPVCKIEPAVLLFSGYERNRRTAHGAVAATVQQGLTTPDLLREWVERMRPLRRAKEFRRLLDDLAGGARSLAEVDVRRACEKFGVQPPRRQKRRKDSRGKFRWIDCEWDLPDGSVLLLEIDGAFHLEVAHYTDDMKRQRRLVGSKRLMVRCSAYEIRHEPGEVMRDLIALGVSRTP